MVLKHTIPVNYSRIVAHSLVQTSTGADPAIKSDRSIVAEGHRRGHRPRPVGGSGGILPLKIFEI